MLNGIFFLLVLTNNFLMKMLSTILSLLGVGFLWGATNPFIRIGSRGIEEINTGSKWRDLWLEARMILPRVNYWVPLLLNQAGSLLYVWTLQSTNITLAVPIANSLSFVFTAITGYLLGEKTPGKEVLFGILLVFVGSTLVLYDQVLNEQKSAQIEFTENVSEIVAK